MHGWNAFEGTVLAAVSAPSAALATFVDSLVAWATWTTMMGFLGVVALALVAAGPAARRAGFAVSAGGYRVSGRVARRRSSAHAGEPVPAEA